MINNRLLLFFLACCLWFQSWAQRPNVGYFQQKTDYLIEVELEEETKMLWGKMELNYQNNSSDTLHYIVFHLWPNAYKNNSTALAQQMFMNGDKDFYWSDEKERGYIDSLHFEVDGKVEEFRLDPQYIDIGYLTLTTPLLPGGKIKIMTPFRVKIPSAKFSRLGYQKLSEKRFMYAISQWFPKPAVYEAEGWMKMPYLNQGEFYSEFGDFEVHIKAPKFLKIAASGSMTFRGSVPLQFGNNKGSDGFEHVYSLTNAHDFAWFAAVDYEMKTRTIKLNSGHEVLLQSYYLYENKDLWKFSLDYIERGVRFYSERVGEYPYDVCTAVDGALAAGGGMEYPTITIISESDNVNKLEITIVHEIGHNWFYGILGFNERDFPWLDEGLNTYYQSLYEDKYFGKRNLLQFYMGEENDKFKKFKMSVKDQYFYSWLFAARRNLDQPLSFYSDEYSMINYGISAYYKSTLMFRYLRSYLGDSEMDSLMQGFFQLWKFKHPQPEDFISYFEKNASKSIDWFFKDLFFSSKNIDYAITKVRQVGDSIRVVVKNKGDLTVPFHIAGLDSAKKVVDGQWVYSSKTKSEISFAKQNVESFCIDYENEMPDYNRNNNKARSNGLFPAAHMPKIRLGYGIPYKGKEFIFLSPIVGGNTTNGFMLGLMAHSDPFFEQRFEYQIAPLYSFFTEDLNGEFNAGLNFYTNGFVRKLNFRISGKKYNASSVYRKVENPDLGAHMMFFRIVPQIDLYLRTPSYTSRMLKVLSFRWLYIGKEHLEYSASNLVYGVPRIDLLQYQMFELAYRQQNRQVVNPSRFLAKIQFNEQIVKTQIEYNQRIHYNESKALDIRFFGGYFFKAKSTLVDYSFKMSNWSGDDDYLYDYTFIGRGLSDDKRFWAHHSVLADGGFSIPVYAGRSWDWMSTVNLTSHLPITEVFRVYFNAGLYPDPIGTKKAQFLYEGGLKFSIVHEYVEFMVPIIFSKEIREVAELNNRDKLSFRLRFNLRVEMANGFKWLREIEL